MRGKARRAVDLNRSAAQPPDSQPPRVRCRPTIARASVLCRGGRAATGSGVAQIPRPSAATVVALAATGAVRTVATAAVCAAVADRRHGHAVAAAAHAAAAAGRVERCRTCRGRRPAPRRPIEPWQGQPADRDVRVGRAHARRVRDAAVDRSAACSTGTRSSTATASRAAARADRRRGRPVVASCSPASRCRRCRAACSRRCSGSSASLLPTVRDRPTSAVASARLIAGTIALVPGPAAAQRVRRRDVAARCSSRSA